MFTEMFDLKSQVNAGMKIAERGKTISNIIETQKRKRVER